MYQTFKSPCLDFVKETEITYIVSILHVTKQTPKTTYVQKPVAFCPHDSASLENSVLEGLRVQRSSQHVSLSTQVGESLPPAG